MAQEPLCPGLRVLSSLVSHHLLGKPVLRQMQLLSAPPAVLSPSALSQGFLGLKRLPESLRLQDSLSHTGRLGLWLGCLQTPAGAQPPGLSHHPPLVGADLWRVRAVSFSPSGLHAPVGTERDKNTRSWRVRETKIQKTHRCWPSRVHLLLDERMKDKLVKSM